MPFLREKSGRWSPEKIIAFVGACVPALWLAWRRITESRRFRRDRQSRCISEKSLILSGLK